MTKWLALLSVGCSAAWPALARAGVRIESKITVNASKTVTNILELQGSRFRANIQDAATAEVLSSTIFDGQRIIRLRPNDKSYTIMTIEDLKAQMEKIEQTKSGLLPPPQAEIDKAKVAPVFSFKRTSGGNTVAGIACENYAMTRDGIDKGSACLSAWKHSGPLTKADLAPMARFSEQMRSVGRRSIGDFQMGPDMDKWPGWPLLTRGLDGKERNRVMKVSRMTFPASEFEVPADYTQKAPTTMGGNLQPHP